MTWVVLLASRAGPLNHSAQSSTRLLHAQTVKLSSKSLKRNEGSGAAQRVPLGRLVNTHGVRGELRLLPYAFPCPTLQKGLTVVLQDKDGSPLSFFVLESV